MSFYCWYSLIQSEIPWSKITCIHTSMHLYIKYCVCLLCTVNHLPISHFTPSLYHHIKGSFLPPAPQATPLRACQVENMHVLHVQNSIICSVSHIGFSLVTSHWQHKVSCLRVRREFGEGVFRLCPVIPLMEEMSRSTRVTWCKVILKEKQLRRIYVLLSSLCLQLFFAAIQPQPRQKFYLETFRSVSRLVPVAL